MSSVRTRLADDATKDYEKLKATLWEAMDSVKRVWLSCPDCKKRSEVEVPDSSARVKAVELALEQGFGRPGQEKLAERGSDLVNDTRQLEDWSSDELRALIAYYDSLKTPEELTAEREAKDQWMAGFLAGQRENETAAPPFPPIPSSSAA